MDVIDFEVRLDAKSDQTARLVAYSIYLLKLLYI